MIIKICGIRSATDAIRTIDVGADLVGLVMVKNSPRHISTEQAKRIIETRVPHVIVFAQTPFEYIKKTLEAIATIETKVQVDYAHPDFKKIVELLPVTRIIPSVRYEDASTVVAPLVVLDSSEGTGKLYNGPKKPFSSRYIMSGGLTPENVGQMIRRYQSGGVDVSSGVESSLGVKDHDRIKEFIQEVKKELI